MNDDLIFEDAKWIIKKLEDHGHQAYFVGGSVRDYLMKKSISDVDITTSALPDEVETIFEKTIPIGKEHGTIIVMKKSQQYEVTTFRKDGDYIDHRRPSSVQFVTDLYEDVARRDFTMNAIAMDKDLQLHDYFNGREDILNKIIRAVGTPIDRMEEDALRIMRGVRFQAQTGFEIEYETKEAMRIAAPSLNKIAIERIIVELKKLIAGRSIHKTIDSIQSLNIFNFIPFFKDIQTDEIFMPSETHFDLWVGALCYIYELDTKALNTLKLSNQEKQEIISYYNILLAFNKSQLSKENLIKLVYKYGKDKVIDIINLIKLNKQQLQIHYEPIIMNDILISEIYDKLPIYHKSELNIDGQVLMSAFKQSGGPWIKDALNQLESAVILNKVNNTESDLIEWVRKYVEI